MENTVLNGVLALIEDRPEAAKEYLGDHLDRSSRASLSARIYGALDKRDDITIIKELRYLLRESLKIQFPADLNDNVEMDAFFLGVKAVEDLIEERLKEF